MMYRRSRLTTILAACVLALYAAAMAGPGGDKNGKQNAPATQPITISEAQRLAQQVSKMNDQVQNLFEKKDYVKCEEVLQKMIKIVPAYDVAWYNLACVQSRTNRPKEAIGSLGKAIELGYCGIQYMEHDPDLAALRDVAGFKELIAKRDQIQRQRGVKIEQALKAAYGNKYLCDIDHEHKLIFATDIDQRTLDEVKTQLTTEAKALWTDLFQYHPEQYLTVIIPSEEDAKALSPSVGGLFQPETNRLIARQIGVTLRHEFTHAMHWGDQQARGQQHSIWVMEGLAGLVESSNFAGGHVHPEPSTRLNMMQALLRSKREMDWKTMFECDQAAFMRHPEKTYPESRYVMMYFFHKGRLKAWYDEYCKTVEKDPSGITATETVFGKKLRSIEADWKEWVLQQTPVPTRPREACLGVQLKDVPDGLEIRWIEPNSGAADAGLKAGDVILKIADKRMVDLESLIAFVARQEVGKVLSVEYRRGEKRSTVKVTLGAMPRQ